METKEQHLASQDALEILNHMNPQIRVSVGGVARLERGALVTGREFLQAKRPRRKPARVKRALPRRARSTIGGRRRPGVRRTARAAAPPGGDDGSDQPGPESGPRICACGCGESLEGRRPQTRFFDDACRNRHHKRERRLREPRPAGEADTALHGYTCRCGLCKVERQTLVRAKELEDKGEHQRSTLQQVVGGPWPHIPDRDFYECGRLVYRNRGFDEEGGPVGKPHVDWSMVPIDRDEPSKRKWKSRSGGALKPGWMREPGITAKHRQELRAASRRVELLYAERRRREVVSTDAITGVLV